MIPVIYFVSIEDPPEGYYTKKNDVFAVRVAVDISHMKTYNQKMQGAKRWGRTLFKRNRWLLLFLGIYLLLSVLLFSPRLFIGGDNARYIILSESIVSGKGYTDIHLPEETPHTKFPFGFPLLLSIPMLLFGYNLFVLKVLVLITGVLGFFFIYRITEQLFKEKTIFVMAFYVFLPLFYVYSHHVMSEIPYLCFSVAAIYFFLEARKNKPVFYHIAFVLAVYSYLLRTAGIALIVAMGVILLFRKEYRYCAILLVMFLVVFIPWQIRNSRIPQTWTYFDEIFLKNPYQLELGRIAVFDIIVRLWENFIFYTFTIFSTIVLPILKSRVIMQMVGFVFLILTILGFAQRIKRPTVIEIYCLVSLTIILIWPRIWSSSRFLLPLTPFLVFYSFLGVFQIARRIKLRFLVHMFVAIFIALNIAMIVPLAHQSIIANSMHLHGNKYAGYMLDWVHYFQIIDWIGENAPQDKVVMARKPEFVYLLSHRKSFRWPFTDDTKEVRKAFWDSDYIILDNFKGENFVRNFLKSVVMEERDNFKIVTKTAKPPFYLIEVKK